MSDPALSGSEEAAGEKETKTLTAAEWAEAAELYELGTAKVAELAARFGVSRQAVSKRFKDHGVIGGSRAHEVKTAVGAAAKVAAVKEAESFYSQRRNRIEQVRTTSFETSKAINALNRKILVECAAGTRTLHESSTINALKSLRLAAHINAQTQNQQFSVLEPEKDVDEAQLPTLKIEDLSDAEIKALQEEDDFDGLEGLIPEDEDDAVVEEDGG